MIRDGIRDRVTILNVCDFRDISCTALGDRKLVNLLALGDREFQGKKSTADLELIGPYSIISRSLSGTDSRSQLCAIPLAGLRKPGE